MKHFYKLLVLFIVFAAPVAGVAQNKGGVEPGPDSPGVYNVYDTACVSYQWNGEWYYSTGNYTDTLTDISGGDSVVTLHLIIYPLPEVTIATTDSIFCGNGVLSVSEVDTNCTYLWSNSTTDSLSPDTVIIVEASDKYYVTITDTNNCSNKDSITIVINPTYSVTDTKSICPDSLPYLWNSVTFTSAGTQVASLQTVNGCDSVVTMTLTVNLTYGVTDMKSICPDSLPYLWNSVTFTAAGTQTATLQTVNGCDSVVTMTLTVNPTYSVTDIRTICQDSLPYTWNGVEFTEAGTQTTTLESVNGCDSVVTMTLTVNPTYNVPDAKTICDNELPYTWNGVEFTGAGTQSVTLHTVNNCDSVVVMTLTVNLIYNVSDSKTICDNELPYTWNEVEFTEAGTQTTTLQTVNGCDSVVVMTLTVNPTYSVTDTRTICQDSLPYTWNGVEFTEAGTQTTTLQTVNGCDSVVTMTLTVNPTFSVTDTITICQSQLPYTWNGVTFTTAGTRIANLSTVNDCDSVVTMTLIVNPTYNTHVNDSICNGSSYNFFGQLITQSGVYTHLQQSVHGCDSTIILHLTVNSPVHTALTAQGCGSYTWTNGNGQTYTTSGLYTFSHADAHGCAQVDTLHLTIYSTYNIPVSAEICQGDSYPFFGQYLNQQGVYTKVLQSSHGCDSIISLTLTVYPIPHSDITGTICEGDTYEFFGQTLTTAGNYTHMLIGQGQHGCDSIVTLHLTINDTMQSPKIIACKRDKDNHPYMLVYPEAGLLYQWYANGVEIPKANQQYYYASGRTLTDDTCYTVRVAPTVPNACGVVTKCWEDNPSSTSKTLILPNPNDGQFRLMIPEGTVNVQILDVNGQVVMTRKVDGDEMLEMNTGLANGLYFVKTFRADGSFNTEKLVINR